MKYCILIKPLESHIKRKFNINKIYLFSHWDYLILRSTFICSF